MQKSLLVPLALMFLLASAFVLTRAAELRVQPAFASGSPLALSTVRGYYAAVGHFLETGDLSQVRTIVAPSSLGDRETDSPRGDLEHYLKSLRQTYPELSINVVSLHAADAVVTAHVEVESGPHVNLDRIQTLNHLRTWRMTETFEVEGNQIVGRWTSGPGLGLYSSYPGSPVEMSLARASHVVTARLTFESGSTGYVSIPAPALLFPERGQIRVEGNGVTSMFREGGMAGELTKPGVPTMATRGDAIFVDASRVVLSNGARTPATLLAIFLAPSEHSVQSREEHSHHDQPIQALENPMGGEIGDGISITPLERGSDVVDAGTVRLVSGWVVLNAGGAVAIRDAATPAIVLPVTGSPVVEHDQMIQGLTVRNLESRQAVLWVVLIG